jgi:hypothetical protein
MPGTEGFTMAAFKACEVPHGTRLYMKPPPKKEWNTDDPDIPSRTIREFIVAVHRQGVPGLPYVLSAYYSNNYQVSRDGDYLQKGWYLKSLGSKFFCLLSEGDVLRGWRELPVFEE